MIELFFIYKWSILIACLSGGALTLLGCHLVERKKTLQTLSLSQGALCGVLLGVAVFQKYLNGVFEILPFFGGILGFLLIWQLGIWLVRGRSGDHNETYLVLFFALLALSELLIAILPGLESHMSKVFFGDLVTASDFELIIQGVISLVALVLLIRFKSQFLKESFELAVFKKEDLVDQRYQILFSIIVIFLICSSIFILGLIFTVGLLFFPTVLLSKLGSKGIFSHQLLCSLVSILVPFLGFLASLYWDALPTVPLILVMIFIISVILIFCKKFISRI